MIPLMLGYGIQKFVKASVQKALEASASYIAIFVIAIIISAVLASNVDKLFSVGYLLFIAVVLHNGLGILMGYWFTRLFTKDSAIARTIAIEVGMQNSGLGVVLANIHFSKLVALPSAIFSFWHNVSGISLAGYWKKRPS